MTKLILTIIFFTQGVLFAHCDGCSPDEKSTGGILYGNVKY